MDAPWSATEDTEDTASAHIIGMAAENIRSELTIGTDTTTRMAIATITMAAVLITAMRHRITTVRLITDGLTIHGPRPSLTDGDGAGRRGMATTVLTSRRIPCIQRAHSG